MSAALAPVPAGAALRADAVPRHAVQLVAADRAQDRVGLYLFASLPALLRAGDLLVVNDAATLPASLAGTTTDGAAFELRLTGPLELRGDAVGLTGLVFGRGDWRTPTELRAAPPALPLGSRVRLGRMIATVTRHTGRHIELVIEAIVEGGGAGTHEAAASLEAVCAAVYAAGRPVQYAHRREPLALWAVQTAYAARPWAVEMPSAGRPLTWEVILALRRARIGIAAITHAAGLGSTGDPQLDAALPGPERYEIPTATATALHAARAAGGRVIAVGTSVVRALEASGGQPGAGVATLRLTAASRPHVVDGLVSGLHVPGESHFDLLRAFASSELLTRLLALATRSGLSAHELGDACLLL